jgi:heme/copper-type cytochrome/quinol oxidase subunit 2
MNTKDLAAKIVGFIDTLATIIATIVALGSVIAIAMLIYYKERKCTQNRNNNNTIEITTTDSCKYTIVPCGKSFIMVPIHDKK